MCRFFNFSARFQWDWSVRLHAIMSVGNWIFWSTVNFDWEFVISYELFLNPNIAIIIDVSETRHTTAGFDLINGKNELSTFYERMSSSTSSLPYFTNGLHLCNYWDAKYLWEFIWLKVGRLTDGNVMRSSPLSMRSKFLLV